MNDMRDWQSLGDEWRGQAVGGVDLDALRREVRMRGRRLQAALAGEVLLTVAVVAWLGWALRHADQPPRVDALFALLIVVSIAFQAWSLWIRRRQLHDGGRDAAALLALELERARTSIRYWRYGTWAGLALWLVLCAVAAIAIPQATDAGRLDGALGGIVGGGAGWLASAAVAWWRGRRTRARLARLHALQDELGEG